MKCTKSDHEEEQHKKSTVDPRLSEPLWPTATKNSFG